MRTSTASSAVPITPSGPAVDFSIVKLPDTSPTGVCRITLSPPNRVTPAFTARGTVVPPTAIERFTSTPVVLPWAKRLPEKVRSGTPRIWAAPVALKA